jgi:hypothetical protein
VMACKIEIWIQEDRGSGLPDLLYCIEHEWEMPLTPVNYWNATREARRHIDVG